MGKDKAWTRKDGPLMPSGRSREPVVVKSGDTLWDIVEEWLGEAASDAEILRAVGEWYKVNRDVIGPDPDLIQPGQKLYPPKDLAAERGKR